MAKIILDSKDNLENIAVDIIADSIKKISGRQKQLVFGVPGGRSVPGIFRLLSEQPDMPWDKIHLFMVDERIVPLDDDGSNFKLVKENLVDNLISKSSLQEANVHPFSAEGNNIDYNILQYKNKLISLGGIYDIALLSVGEDCHIASLFPEHHSIKNESPYYLWMSDSPKPPPCRMTMSKHLLLQSRVAIMLIFGKSKKRAYCDIVDDKTNAIQCPAKLVLQIKDSYVLTDIKL